MSPSILNDQVPHLIIFLHFPQYNLLPRFLVPHVLHITLHLVKINFTWGSNVSSMDIIILKKGICGFLLILIFSVCWCLCLSIHMFLLIKTCSHFPTCYSPFVPKRPSNISVCFSTRSSSLSTQPITYYILGQDYSSMNNDIIEVMYDPFPTLYPLSTLVSSKNDNPNAIWKGIHSTPLY